MAVEWTSLDGGQREGYVTAYVNARVVDPESTMDVMGYVITKGKEISEFGAGAPRSEVDEVIDCHGCVLMPGIVDIHVHFREPGEEHKETIETGSKSAAAGGVTTVVCQPNTRPRIDNVATAEYIKAKAAKSSYTNIEFYGSITKEHGALSDMSSLKDAGAVGFTDDGLPVMNASIMRQALRCANDLGLVVAQHAEDSDLCAGGCVNEGKVAWELGVNGMPSVAEAILVGRDIALLKSAPGVRYHVLHVSTKESIELIKAAKCSGFNVTCEVAPHHFILNEYEVVKHGSMAKMNPPLRSEEDRLSMVEGLKNGVIDCIATDHAPHSAGEKGLPLAVAPFGVVGLETLLPLSLHMYHSGHMGLLDVLSKLTYKPADIIKVPRGRIRRGLVADFTIFDPDYKWTVDVSKFASKSKNSPFHSMEVRGMVFRTVVSGKTTYRRLA